MLDTVVVIMGTLWFFTRMPVVGAAQLVTMLYALAYAAIGFFWTGKPAMAHKLKVLLLAGLIASTIGFRTAELIHLRHLSGNVVAYVHDHPLQNEGSTAFLLQGKNPYTQDFRSTELVNWSKGNPALDHVIALPVTFFKSIPFHLAWHAMFGWYDDRVSHLALLILMVVALYCIPRTPDMKLLAMSLAFAPLFAQFFPEGRSDVIFLSFMLASFAFLRREKTTWGLVFMALAFGSKHTAILIAPFLAVYLWKKGAFAAKRRRAFIAPLALLAAIFVPFLLWDFTAFMIDTYHYPAGTLPTSYPVNGFSLQRILYMLGIDFPYRSPAPTVIGMAVVTPLLVLLVRHVLRKPTLGNVLLSYGSFIWVFWFFSRFFHDNYMGVVMVILGLAAILLHEEKAHSHTLHLPGKGG